MSNRLEARFGSVGATISRYLRITLLIICTAIVLAEIHSLVCLVSASRSYYLSDFKFESHGYHYGQTILLLLAGLLGLLGAYRSDQKLMSAFAFLIISGCIYIVIVQAFIDTSAKRNEEIEKITPSLPDYLKNYDWRGTSTLPVAIHATKVWDTIQERARCCGLFKYTDWNPVRPTFLGNATFPKSCCLKSYDNLCQVKEVFQVGCKERLGQLLANDATSDWIRVASYLVASLVSALYLYDNIQSQH